MVFCFESDMVSVLIVDDVQRGASENTRHKAGLALAIIAIIIGILVLLSPCIKCLILRRQGKSWRAAMQEALQSTAPNQRRTPRSTRPYQLQPRRSHWKIRFVRLLSHGRQSEETLPTWALSPPPDTVPLPPPAHVRHGSISETQDPLGLDALPAYSDEAGRPPKYQEMIP